MLDKELLATCKTAAEQIRRCDYTPARSTLLTAIKKAEAAMSKPQPDADGWIKWEGGECPVSGDARVEVCSKKGSKNTARASMWQWRHLGYLGDIIAYRIVEGD